MPRFWGLMVAMHTAAWAQAPVSVSVSKELQVWPDTAGQVETYEQEATTRLGLGTGSLTLRAAQKHAVDQASVAVYTLSGGVEVSSADGTFSTDAARVTVSKAHGERSVVLVSSSWHVQGEDLASAPSCGVGPPSGDYSAIRGRLYRNGERVAGDGIDWSSGAIDPQDSNNDVVILAFPPGENPDCQRE